MNLDILRNPVLIWFIIGFVMFLLELAGPGLIMFFFGVGAWVVAFVCLFADITLDAQLFLFVITSVLSLMLFRKTLRKFFSGHIKNQQDPSFDLEEFVGHKATVKQEINPGRIGKVEFNGTLWEAEADEAIGIDEIVEITQKVNLTLKVKKTG